MSYSTIDKWIASEAIASTLKPDGLLHASIDALVAALGSSVELLGLGEALHGGEEILVLRNQMFRRLAETHGFSAIAVESSFPRGRPVNDYVAGGGPASFAEVAERGFSHGFGALEANRELVESMRQHNRDATPNATLAFYGFDSPTEMMHSDSPRASLEVVLEFVSSMDEACGKRHRERIEPLVGDDAAWENQAAMTDPSKSIGLSPAACELRLATEDLAAEFQVKRPEWIAKSDELRFREAMQFATVARQLLTYHATVARPSETRTADLLGLRDAMMADNLAYILEQERRRVPVGGRVLVFAHNSHLKCGRAEWQWGPNLLVWWPAGAHLRAMVGRRYAVIGSAVGVSEANGIGAPEPESLEARLLNTPGPLRFVTTQRAGGELAGDADSLPTRSGSAKNGSYFPLTSASLIEFDAFAVFDSLTYVRGGPQLP